MRSGQKILSILLLVPILTILAHNSIPHHHHASPAEICCDNQQSHSGTVLLLNASGHASGSHHDACCFNPEFTIDFFKILISAPESDPVQITCPLKQIESVYQGWFPDNALCRINPAPNLLRGPPSLG